MELSQSESPLVSAQLSGWQKSLLANLSHKRTVLAVCEYYQRHALETETTFVALMDELLEAYREEIADLSRLLRLYDVPPSQAEFHRNLVRDGRSRRTTLTRLELLLGLSQANAHWYQRELERQPPPDIAALWNSLLAAENQRIQRVTTILQPESSAT